MRDVIPDPDYVAENDQTAARARDDLDRHVGSMRNLLTQANGDGQTALVVCAATLIDATDSMPRDRLASMLAVALLRLAEREASGLTDEEYEALFADERPR